MVVVRVYLLLHLIASSVQNNLISQKIFNRASCTLTFLDDVRWFGSSGTSGRQAGSSATSGRQAGSSATSGRQSLFYGDNRQLLVSGDNYISTVRGCQVTQNQVFEGAVSPILEVADVILFCSDGALYQTTPNLTHISAVTANSDNYMISGICQHAPKQRVHYKQLGEVIYSASEKERRYPARFSKLDIATGWIIQASESDMLDIQSVVTVFQHRHFVYSVYKNAAGEGIISRVCSNDTGSYGNFKTYRYGTISCKLHPPGVSHKSLLSARYDPGTSSLLILTSRPPVDLSARLLCRLSLQHVDQKLDTGFFLDYDELGSPTRTAGTATQCSDREEMRYMSQLTDVIHTTDVIVKRVADYRAFDLMVVGNETWFYLANEHSIDVWKEEGAGRSSLIQTIRTHVSISDISLHDDELFLVGGASITRAPAFLCSHVTDPIQCYSPNTPFCGWSRDLWECVRRPERSSFTEDFPRGIVREVITDAGCAKEITLYTPDGIATVHEVMSCDYPHVSSTSHLLAVNTTCLGLVRIECTAGTALVTGDLVRQCLPDATWTGNPPVCRERKCSILYPPPGSTLTSPDTAVGSRVKVSCLDECQESESDVPVVCLESGEWNSTRLPACAYKTCLRLPTAANTIVLFSEDPPVCGSKVVVECRAGYSLVFGDKVRYCRADGSWDGSLPFCAVTHCAPLDHPPNSRLSASSHRVTDTVTVTCDTCHKVKQSHGFRVSATTQCLNTGEWSNTIICQEVKCATLQPNPGVRMKQMNNSCIGMAEFECEEGYRLLSGALVRHCQPDGKWSGSQPHCQVVSCPAIEIMMNSVESANLEVTWIGRDIFREKILFRCIEDSYLASGSLELYCLSTGVWSGDVPVCLPFSDRIDNNTVTVSPEYMSAELDASSGDGALLALAVIGWMLFVAAVLFIITVFVLVKYKGQLLGLEQELEQGQIASCQVSSYERQVTQLTTTDSSSQSG